MSRHRDVRNMDYSEDYDGYDDVYGHSVDDDFYISPSHRQFMYSRENSAQAKNADVYPMEEDIQEEDEIDEEILSEIDKTKLQSCIEQIKSLISPLNMTRQELVRNIIENKFDSEKSVNSILNIQSTKGTDRKEKGDTISKVFSQCAQSNRSTISSSMISHNSCKLSNLNLSKQENQGRNYKISKVENNISRQAPENSSTFVNENEEINEPSLSFISRINCQSKPDNSASQSFVSKIKNMNNKVESFDSVDGKGTNYQKRHNGIIKINMRTEGSDCVDGKTVLKDHSLNRLILNKKEVEMDPSLSFISKLKPKSSNSISDSFLSKLNKRNNEMKISPHPSSNNINIGKLKLPMNNLELDSEGSSVDSLDNTSPTDAIKSFTENFKDLLQSSHKNDGIENSEQSNNVKMNFLNRIRQKESLNHLKTNTDSNISKDLSMLKLTETKSVPTMKTPKIWNGCDLDLTAALRKNVSGGFKLKVRPSHENFEMPFVSCDNEERILRCKKDVSGVLSTRNLYDKRRPSQFGKILCLRYRSRRIARRKIFYQKFSSKISTFNFGTPSPDDKIRKHIRSEPK